MQEDNNNKNLTWRNGHRLYQKKLQRSTATNQEYEELSRKVTVQTLPPPTSGPLQNEMKTSNT